MISRIQNRRGAAFTLVEIIVVIALIALVITMSVISLQPLNAERRVMEPAIQLKKYARDAHRMAMATQRSYSIEMRDRYFVLRETHVREDAVEEWEQAMREQQLRAARSEFFDEEEIAAPLQRIIERYELPIGTQVQWKRWIDQNFVDIEPEQAAEWQFDPSGICEPVGIRFTSDDGFIEMVFNPLTAKVEDERMIVSDTWRDSL